MRLSILSTMAEAPWGGSEELWAGAALAAIERGWTVSALLPHFNDPHPKRAALASAGVALSSWKGEETRKWMAGADAALRNPYQTLLDPRPDLVVISHGGMLDMVNGHVGMLSDLWRSGVPYVLIIQANTEGYWPNETQRAFMRRYFAGALQVVFVSRENLEIARRQLADPLSNAVVWQQPVNLAAAKPVKWPTESVLTMASVARIDVGSKGQDMLIEILSRPIWRDREWKLNLYGTGISAALVQDSAVQGGIRDRVQFHGQVADIAQLWRSNHVLVMPSRLEGTPLALLEALCCGRPAMVTAVGGSADWIVEGETGFVAPAARTELVAEALERLWQNRAALAKMGDAAARFMAASFDPKPGASLLRYLERVLQRRTHANAAPVARPRLSVVRLGGKASRASCESIPGVEWIDVHVGESGDVSRQPDRTVVPEPLKNPAVAANSGLAVASGEWAMVLEQNDQLTPEYVRSTIAVLEAGLNFPAYCSEVGTPPKLGVFPLRTWLGCGGFSVNAREDFQAWFWSRLAAHGVTPKLVSAVAIPRQKGRAETANPKVSVVVTCYNYADYLGRCLDSVLAQTYRDFEVIIVNDGSTDHSGKVADAIAALHSDRVRVLHQPNAGQPAISRNNGIRLARGELILPLDADDWIAPTMLQECVAALESTNAGVAYTDTIYCHDRGQVRMYFGGEFSVRALREQNQLNCCSMYRKKVWETVGGYRENVRGYEDWDFWLAAAAAGFTGKRIAQPLFLYRAKETGVFAQTSGKDKILKANIRLNNPSCYSAAERADASAFLAAQAKAAAPAAPVAPAAPARVPEEPTLEALRQQVANCYGSGDMEGCVRVCAASLEREANDPDILVVYADALTKLGRLPEALAALDRLIQLQPEVEDHRQLRASVAAAAAGQSAQPSVTPMAEPSLAGKRILVYSDDPGMGGAAHYNHTILLAARKAGAQVFSAQPERDTPLIREQAAAGVAHRWLSYDPVKAFVRSFTDDADAERIIGEIKPDLVFFSDCCALSNIAAKTIAVKYRVPFVLVCHSEAGYLAERFPQVLGIVGDLLNAASEVIAVSQSSRGVLQKSFNLPSGKGVVIYSGRSEKYFAPRSTAARERIRAELALPTDAVLCLTVARHDGDKGFGHQLEAVARLIAEKRIGSLYFAWAGEGDAQPQLAEVIRKHKLEDRIRMLGYRWDVADLIDAADIFVLPSRSEALPLCTMEAMAKGVPVIATAVGGIPEQLGNAGKLLPNPNVNAAGTVSELVAALVRWHDNPAERRVIGEAGRQRAIAMFREETMIAKTLGVLAAAAERAPHKAVPHGGPTTATVPKAPAEAAEPVASKREGPLVSVVVPCYQQAQFLPEAVESVVAQTFTDWEIIIVDDGSPDDTSAVAQRLIAAYPERKIRLVQKQNGGLADARNAGITVARGRYILPLDADDRIHPEMLAKTVGLLETNPKVGIAYVDWQYFGADNRVRQARDYDFRVLCAQENLFTCTSLYRKEAWEAAGGYNRNMTCGLEDWDFWIGCGEKGFFGQRIPEVLFYYRSKTGSMIETVQPNVKTMIARIVQNHPGLYSAGQLAAANRVTAEANLPAPKPSSVGVEWTPTKSTSQPAPAAVAPTPPTFGVAKAREIEEAVKAYVANPSDSAVAGRLQQLRAEFVKYVLTTDAAALAVRLPTELGAAYRAMVGSGIALEPLTAEQTTQVIEWLDRASAESTGRDFDCRPLIAYSFFVPAHRRPLPFAFERIPTWYLDDYLVYLLTAPQVMVEPGEAEAYLGHLEKLTGSVLALIQAKPNAPLARKVATIVGTKLNCIPAYMAARNTKPFMVNRAAVLEYVLTSGGAKLDVPLRGQRHRAGKIRVGFLSAHFGEQTETHVTLPTLQLDRSRFEVWLFPLATTNSPVENYCRSFADKFTPLPRDLGQQVKQIRDAALDVVIIGTNVTAVTNNVALLAAHRLAPLQLVSYCSPMTTGFRNVDGYLYGSFSEFDGVGEHFSEKLVVCDGAPGCLDYTHEKAATMSFERKALGLRDDETVFINAASCFKIPPELLDTWARILKRVEKSRLILLPFNPNWSNAFPARRFTRLVEEAMKRHGVSMDRVLLVRSLPSRADVKALEKLADVYLDTFPFSGSLSVIDPLELGVPTLVLPGATPRSRAAASLLRDLEMPELVMANEDAYIEHAVQLGLDKSRREEIGRKLRERMQRKPRFLDGKLYGRQLSAVLAKWVATDPRAAQPEPAMQCA